MENNISGNEENTSENQNSYSKDSSDQKDSTSANNNPALNPETMHKNADTDPNRYSNFGRDDSASDGSDNADSPENDSNPDYTGHYSVEDDRLSDIDHTLGVKPHTDTESGRRQTENEKEGFSDGL